jgi:hypothetical protein
MIGVPGPLEFGVLGLQAVPVLFALGGMLWFILREWFK